MSVPLAGMRDPGQTDSAWYANGPTRGCDEYQVQVQGVWRRYLGPYQLPWSSHRYALPGESLMFFSLDIRWVKQTFLSSSEAQHVINSLWRGDWVQKNNANDDIDYQPYEKVESGYFWDHLNPQRLAVPRYQTIFKQVVWMIFLFGE